MKGDANLFQSVPEKSPATTGRFCEVKLLTGACYIRVSTDDQTEFSPDAQLKAIKEYAKKNDIVLTKEFVFVDEGISGKRADKRPAFMKMIATAKEKPKPFDVILVHKFDRFARSREDSVVYKSLLKKEAGVRVVSITESIEDDKFAVILEAMLEAMAEYYSLNLAEEVKKGMTEKASRGEFQSRPPFGYTTVNKKLVVVEDEAKIVRFMYDKFASREMNMRQLATYINGLNIKTKSNCKFDTRAIQYILCNTIYIGKVRWTPTGKVKRHQNHPDTIVKDSDHEPLIDMDLWEKTQAILQDFRETYRHKEKSTAAIKTWLKGLVKCSSCGRMLVTNKVDTLQCNGYCKGVCKVNAYIKMRTIEDLVLEELKQTFKEKLDINIIPKASNTTTASNFDVLNEQLIKLQLREQRIKEAYQDGIDTKEEYRQNKERLEEERNKILDELSNIKDVLMNGESGGGKEIYSRIKTVYDLLKDENVDMEIKYQTAHFLIQEITFDKKEKRLKLQYK